MIRTALLGAAGILAASLVLSSSPAAAYTLDKFYRPGASKSRTEPFLTCGRCINGIRICYYRGGRPVKHPC